MGASCNQQTSKPHGSAQCGVQNSRRTAARSFYGPGRANSIFATAIRLATGRAERPPHPKSATCALHARSIAILQPAAVFAHRSARKTFRLMYRISRATYNYGLTREKISHPALAV